AASVGVAPGVHRDAVVASIERTILDEHVIDGLGIAAVVVRPVAVHLDAAQYDVPAHHGMDVPEGRVAHPHALDEHVLAAVRLDERRAQHRTVAKHAILHRHAGLGHLEQFLAGRALVGHALLPAVVDRPAPRTFPPP